MRLATITVRRFKAIHELTLCIPKTDVARPGSADFVSLVGQNNAAKSSVLEALRLVMPGTDLPTPTIDHFPGRDKTKGPIEIELEFEDLSVADQAEQGIRSHVHAGKYRVKKVWSDPGAKPSLFAYEPSFDIPTWPAKETTRAQFEAGGADWLSLLAAYDALGETFPARTAQASRDKLRELAVSSGSPLVVPGPAAWQPNPGGFSSHVDSVLPKVIFVAAIKETSAEASVTRTKSAAREIVESMFEIELGANPAVKQFTQAGEAVKAIFAGGGVGSEIVRRVEEDITKKLQRLIDLKAALDFTPPDITADLASKTILEVVDGDLRTRPEHQGHGAQRSLILSLLELLAEKSVKIAGEGFRRSIILLIEEPEIYLHPQMCRKMRDVLLTIARSGTAQVVCTTHSPVFLDLADRHDGIGILRREAAVARLFQRTDDLFGGAKGPEARARLRMVLDFDASLNEVFFARHVCLVEGDSEIAAVDAVGHRLSELGSIDKPTFLHARRDLALVNCRGKWTICAFQRVLNAFEIPYRVVHDDDGEGTTGANAAILSELGGDGTRRVLHSPNFEQQVFGERWTNDKPWRTQQRVQASNPVHADLVRLMEFSMVRTSASLARPPAPPTAPPAAPPAALPPIDPAEGP